MPAPCRRGQPGGMPPDGGKRPAEVVAEDREVTGSIRREMRAYHGYIRHVIVEDLDEPGQLVVVNEWESREDADRVRSEYADNPNRKPADEHVAEPRRPIVAQVLSI